VPPKDSGVVNVKDYGAEGDGKTDDTAAIRKAISENIDRSRYAAPPMIWLPSGTYLVSAPIEGRQYKDLKGWSFGWRAGFLLVGQGRTKSVLKLKDACEGYTDAANPRYVVATGSEMNGGGGNEGGGGNQAFRHCIANLTVDVGSGNPGATGIDFIANNRGTVENVLIRARAGRIGPHRPGDGPELARTWADQGGGDPGLRHRHLDGRKLAILDDLRGHRTEGSGQGGRVERTQPDLHASADRLRQGPSGADQR